MARKPNNMKKVLEIKGILKEDMIDKNESENMYKHGSHTLFKRSSPYFFRALLTQAMYKLISDTYFNMALMTKQHVTDYVDEYEKAGLRKEHIDRELDVVVKDFHRFKAEPKESKYLSVCTFDVVVHLLHVHLGERLNKYLKYTLFEYDNFDMNVDDRFYQEYSNNNKKRLKDMIDEVEENDLQPIGDSDSFIAVVNNIHVIGDCLEALGIEGSGKDINYILDSLLGAYADSCYYYFDQSKLSKAFVIHKHIMIHYHLTKEWLNKEDCEHLIAMDIEECKALLHDQEVLRLKAMHLRKKNVSRVNMTTLIEKLRSDAEEKGITMRDRSNERISSTVRRKLEG